MTLTQKRKQLIALFGAYSIQLEKLYDRFVYRLAKLAKSSGVSVEDLLDKDALYNFDNYPELREQLQEIMRDFYKEGILAIKSGIASGAALATTHDNSTLSHYSILSNKALNQVRDNAAMAYYAFRMKPEQGLSLSSNVWNYVRQAKSEVEAGISCVITDGLTKGTSAEELARRVKVYLNEPDMMWRRYHEKVFVNGQKKDIAYWRKKVVDENGKVHFIKTEPYHPGQGVYRSSRKNALRMARTEINGSYHYTNYQRWKKEPFVIGIRIWMSPEHPEVDICDELAGDYPKDFFFPGWHPQCICAAMPLTLQGKEKEDFYKRLAKGEDMSNYVSPNRVKDVPQAYKDYVQDDKKAIMKAAENGKLAWHLSYNQKYWTGEFTAAELEEMGLEPIKPAVPKKRIKTEEEKADIQRRWNERKERNRILDKGRTLLRNLKDYPKIDSKDLEAAIKKGRAADVVFISRDLQKKIDFERSITPTELLDSVMRKKYGDEAVDALYENAERTIRNKVNTKSDIEDKITALRYEADWIVKNRDFATKNEVAAYYEREAKRLEAMRDFDLVKADIEIMEKRLSKYGVKSVLTGKEWYLDIDEMRKSLKSLDKYKEKIERVEKLERYAMTSKSPDIKAWSEGIQYALQLNGIDANIEELLSKAEERIKRIEYDKAYAERKKAEKLEKERREKLAALMGKVTTVEDLRKALGSEMPKTLKELDKAIKECKFTDTSEKFKKNRDVIEPLFKKLFDENDWGMDIDANLLESVYENGFCNTFQSGTSGGYHGSSKTTGKIESSHSRLRMSHKLFMPSTYDEYYDKQLERKEYEKYGHLLDRDKYDALTYNRTHYGDTQVRFKKDKVLATWTFDDSLGCTYQPSLVTDPKVESLDRENIEIKGAPWESLYKLQREFSTSYIEMQYHGKLDIDCVESITFGSNPEFCISKELIRKLLAKGIELWYRDGTKVVRYHQ